MAMIPTITARMPARINEVDVCLNMRGIPFGLAQRTATLPNAAVPVSASKRHRAVRRPTPVAYSHIAGDHPDDGAGRGCGSWTRRARGHRHARAPRWVVMRPGGEPHRGPPGPAWARRRRTGGRAAARVVVVPDRASTTRSTGYRRKLVSSRYARR